MLLKPLGALFGPLGALFGPLGALFGPLGASWGGLGALLGPPWGGLLGVCWHNLIFERFWDRFWIDFEAQKAPQ